MSIELLSRVDQVTGATYFAANVNGQDYRLDAATLLAYMQNGLEFPSDYVPQYAAPNATGFSVSVTNGPQSMHLILTPTGSFAAGTLVLPSSAVAVDGQRVLVNCTQIVTALTVSGNGATVTGAPDTLAANAFFTLKYDKPTNVWYRVG